MLLHRIGIFRNVANLMQHCIQEGDKIFLYFVTVVSNTLCLNFWNSSIKMKIIKEDEIYIKKFPSSKIEHWNRRFTPVLEGNNHDAATIDVRINYLP